MLALLDEKLAEKPQRVLRLLFGDQSHSSQQDGRDVLIKVFTRVRATYSLGKIDATGVNWLRSLLLRLLLGVHVPFAFWWRVETDGTF